MVSLASLLTLVVAGFYITTPLRASFNVPVELYSDDATGAGVGATSALEQDQRERLVQMLKDLQLDYDLGAISKDEYDRMYASLSAELAPLLSE